MKSSWRRVILVSACSAACLSCTPSGDDDDEFEFPATGGARSSGSDDSTGGRSARTVDAGRNAHDAAADDGDTGGRSSTPAAAGSSNEGGSSQGKAGSSNQGNGGSSSQVDPPAGGVGNAAAAAGAHGWTGGSTGQAGAEPSEDAGLESDADTEQDAGPSPDQLAHEALRTCATPECGQSYAMLSGDGTRQIDRGPAFCLLDALGSRVPGLYKHAIGSLDSRGLSSTEHLFAVQADGTVLHSACTDASGSYYERNGTAGTTCTGVEQCQLVESDQFAECEAALPASDQEPDDVAWTCLYGDPGDNWLSTCESTDVDCD